MKAVFETRWAKIGETEEHYRSTTINGSDDAAEWAKIHLRPYFEDKRDAEEVLAITLDTKHRPFSIVRITRGTLSQSLLAPREVFRPAIADCAAAIILAHNHPSGDPTPSAEDIAVTKRLVQCGDLLGVRVLDHLVIGDFVISMASRCLM